MACESIGRGRALQCKNNFAGLKAVGFLNYVKLTLGGEGKFGGLGLAGQEIFRYELKNDGNLYDEDTVNDRNTSTSVSTGTLTLVLPTLDSTTRDEIAKMGHGRPIVFLEHFDGQITVIGFENGAELTSAKLSSGGGRADLAGFTLTFESVERRPLVFLNAAGITAYEDAVNTTDIIVPGVSLPSGS